MGWITYILVIVLSYLLGSVPTGFLAGKAKGLDIRSIGSGNIGATNVFRALGTTAGILVLVLDGLKGFVAATWLCDAVQHFLPIPQDQVEYLRITAGLASVLGHNFTCWLSFKGGKGIATSAGVLAALVPWALLVILAVWVIVFAVSRYVSLASICASAVLPFAAWLTGGTLTLILVTGAMSTLAIYKHKGNLQRLLNGTEHRFGSKRREATS